MEARDLMIGDWVYRPDCHDQVKEIRQNGIIGLDSLRGLIGFSEIKPIPLTPEILEKNGWESMKNGSGDFILTNPMVGNDATITKTINGYAMLHGVFNGLSVHYVHELQHVLRLCKIKKEIIL